MRLLKRELTLTVCRKNLFAFVSLFLLILIPYANTFNGSWHFDDINNIVENKPLHLNKISFENIEKTFFASWDGQGKLYRPVACLSFALNYYLDGANVTGYHLINLTVHFISACFLFLFIYHTLNLPVVKSRYTTYAYFIAFLSTALWAVNPVQTQAITYVVQRMASMAGMFSIMAMFFYLRGRTASLKPIQVLFFMICAFCILLAMGSKENAIMLPLILFFYDLFLIGGITKSNLKKYALVLLIILGVCVLAAVLLAGPNLFDPRSIVSRYQNRGFTLFERLLTEPRILLFYISLLLYPMPNRLCLEHDIALSKGLCNPASTFLSILAIVLILGTSLATSRKKPLMSFCILFFFMSHLPEGSFLPLELIFEHRNYFPSMLFFVPFAVLFSAGISFFSHKRLFQILISGLAVLVLVGWGHGTYARNKVWQTDETLWIDCAIKNPKLGRPHHNLGVFYGKNNQPDKAAAEYIQALTHENPNNLVARNWSYYNLGAIYQKLRKDKAALFYYDEAQKYQPHFAPTHLAKGIIFMRNGQFDAAAMSFEKAIKSDPSNISALGNLGFLLLLTGKPANAVKQLETAARKDPENPKIQRHLGIAHRLSGNSAQAFRHFLKAFQLDKKDALTLLNLTDIYTEKGMLTERDQAMDRFFALFCANKLSIKAFINSLKNKPNTPPNRLIRHRQKLLSLIRHSCLQKSDEYKKLAVLCTQKKGGPAK